MAAAMFAAQIAAQKAAQSGGSGIGGPGKIDMKKYERMKKMGLPMNSIVNRMKMDGVEMKTIETFAGAAAKKAKPTDDDKQLMPAQYKSSKKLKALHWAKMNMHQSQQTVFKTIEKEINNICTKLNFTEIEQLFNKDADQNKNTNVKKKKRDHQLIDPKRAQNVMIGLSQVKMTEDDLLDAILKMDDKKLALDKLRKLLPYVPSDGELQMVRDFVKNGGNVNDLSKVEQFFVKMMDMVGIRERISLWIFKLEFPNILLNVNQRIKLVSDTINLLMTSKRLQKILLTILTIGNYLNSSSTARGNAFGFLMEPTLSLLDGVKSNTKPIDKQKQISLMFYCVETIYKSDPDALKIIDDLEIIELSFKVKTNSILNDLDAIKRDMTSINKLIKEQKRTMTKMASDWARDGAAVSVNQIASHIRKLSKQGPNAMFAGCETYSNLRVGVGLPGAVQPSFAKMNKADLNDDILETENEFGKVMLLFYKKSNSKVTETETFLKKTQSDTKKLATYFGFEGSKKWEEILVIFYMFRESLIKAMRNLKAKQEKLRRIAAQNQKKNQLASKLAKRPPKDQVANVVQNVDLDDASTNNDKNDPQKQTSAKGKAQSMYADYMKKKKQTGSAADKKMWV